MDFKETRIVYFHGMYVERNRIEKRFRELRERTRDSTTT